MALHNVSTCLDSEGIALQHGMKLTKALNLEKVIFETYNTNVAEILWYGNASAHLTKASRRHFCIEDLSNHTDWQVKLIRREKNVATDVAAKHAKDTGLS